MDPNKTPSAPPPGWNSEDKSNMAYPPPPPYQDYPSTPTQVGTLRDNPLLQDTPQHHSWEGPRLAHTPRWPAVPPGPYPQGPQPMVTVQPTLYVTQGPLARPLPDYLGYSIFTLLCCCLPLGIAALVYSISTRDANSRGHQQLAEHNSRLARNLNHAGLGIGITMIILWIVLMFFIH